MLRDVARGHHGSRQLAAKQVGGQGAVAAVRHDIELQPGGLGELQSGEVGLAAEPRCAEHALLRMALDPVHVLFDVGGAGPAADGERQRIRHHHGHRRQVLQQVVLEHRRWIEQAREDAGGVGRDHIGEPVRRTVLQHLGGHPATGARPVLDDHRLAQHAVQLVGEHTRHGVRRAAGREAYQQANGKLALGLGAKRQSQGHYAERSLDGSDESHVLSPVCRLFSGNARLYGRCANLCR